MGMEDKILRFKECTYSIPIVKKSVGGEITVFKDIYDSIEININKVGIYTSLACSESMFGISFLNKDMISNIFMGNRNINTYDCNYTYSQVKELLPNFIEITNKTGKYLINPNLYEGKKIYEDKSESIILSNGMVIDI